jgi:lipopolysaccharide/colanic/teichoic acid biosynthesis glycosyltransferase
MSAKRIFDLFWVIPGLLLLMPLMLFISCWIRFDSNGPALFRQVRVGFKGKHFQVLKFRTMVVDAEEKGDKITIGGDLRITNAGKWLRKYKLDELPQLFNVFKGEMSLVGPRPEVPEYMEFYSEHDREVVLSVRPGITDMASIEFRNENELLRNSEDPVKEYRENILPVKIGYYKKYVREHSLSLDLVLLLKTVKLIMR